MDLLIFKNICVFSGSNIFDVQQSTTWLKMFKYFVLGRFFRLCTYNTFEEFDFL